MRGVTCSTHIFIQKASSEYYVPGTRQGAEDRGEHTGRKEGNKQEGRKETLFLYSSEADIKHLNKKINT